MSHRGNEDIADQRAIIDRRAVADSLASLKPGRKLGEEAGRFLAEALAAGRTEIARRLTEEPGNGRSAAQAIAFLHDQLVRLAWDFVCTRLLDPASGAGIALVGLGGTG
ncbi:MAG: bifunctional uridylyltransferase/uridylyl-removing protein, partial [Sphingomicrobium sp.]